MVIFEILIGLIPAYPLFLGTNKFLMSRKPVVEKIKPTVMTPLIQEYKQRQLEIEGRVAPKAVEAKMVTAPNKNKKLPEKTILESNYEKWMNNSADIPFVKKSVVVLKTLSEAASLELSIEEEHNLEVLSKQTDTLLSEWYATPERIRNLSEVKKAFSQQLTEIEEGTDNMTTSASKNLVRNLNAGAGFIQAKFNNKDHML